MKISAVLLGLGVGAMAHGGELTLVNDSPSTLKAVIRAATGEELGAVVLMPQATNSWSNWENQEENPTLSQTPYTVSWQCLDGVEFSFCSIVGEGATVTALGCDGDHVCPSVGSVED